MLIHYWGEHRAPCLIDSLVRVVIVMSGLSFCNLFYSTILFAIFG